MPQPILLPLEGLLLSFSRLPSTHAFYSTQRAGLTTALSRTIVIDMKVPRNAPDDIKELLGLVRTGKLFALQDWIKAGKPLRNPKSEKSDSSVLRAAVETGFHSMVEELLRAGGWSPKDLSDALKLARTCRHFEIAQLLNQKGAEPRQATFRTACETLDLFMIEHLLRSGADPNRDNVFAEVLNSTKARPLLRFFRQLHKEFPALEDQAALALTEAVKNRQVRWTALLAWAGADPFRHVPNDLAEPFRADPDNFTTAAAEASWHRNPELLKVLHLKPNAQQALELLEHISYSDDFKFYQTLLSSIPREHVNNSARGSSTALEQLVGRWPYTDMFHHTPPGKGDAEALQCVEMLLDLGAKWNPPAEELRHIRRSLLKHDSRYVVQLLRLLLHTPNAANIGSFLEICRSQTLMQSLAGEDAPLVADINELRKHHRDPVTTTAQEVAKDIHEATVLPAQVSV